MGQKSGHYDRSAAGPPCNWVWPLTSILPTGGGKTLHGPPGQALPEGGMPSALLVSVSWSVGAKIGLRDLVGDGSP